VRLAVGNDPNNKEWLDFASGDFITDWNTAIARFVEIAAEQGYDQVLLSHSSSVDWWENDSCQYIEIEPDGVTEFFTRWRRCTSDEERAARDALAAARA
jgi:hypothetical protein